MITATNFFFTLRIYIQKTQVMFTILYNQKGFHSIFTATLKGRTLSFQCFSESDSKAFTQFVQDVDANGDQLYEAEEPCTHESLSCPLSKLN